MQRWRRLKEAQALASKPEALSIPVSTNPLNYDTVKVYVNALMGTGARRNALTLRWWFSRKNGAELWRRLASFKRCYKQYYNDNHAHVLARRRAYSDNCARVLAQQRTHDSSERHCVRKQNTASGLERILAYLCASAAKCVIVITPSRCLATSQAHT